MTGSGSGQGVGRQTARRTLIVVAILAVALLVWQVRDALLLLFIGILLAVFWRGLARLFSRHTKAPISWSLGAVALLLIGVVVGGSVLLGPRVSEQFTELSRTLPATIEQARQSIQQTEWSNYLLGQMQGRDGGLRIGGDVFSRLTGTASRVLAVLTNVLLILFAAIFFGIDPDLYKRGLVLLVPQNKAARVSDTLDAVGEALWKWLIGKGVAMLFVGIVVTLGLLLIGVPLALTLGIIAGLLDFVPFIGPIVAAAPGILLALTLGPSQAIYAALVYFVAQQIEGNVVTPLIQQKEVSLPPVLVLFAVIAAGLLFGLLGVIVATPLVVVAMVSVKLLYVEDVLGKKT